MNVLLREREKAKKSSLKKRVEELEYRIVRQAEKYNELEVSLVNKIIALEKELATIKTDRHKSDSQ